jgi:DNA-binding NarL/FixJ family response regulator
VITDVRMPPGHADDGLRAAHEIRQRLPATAVDRVADLDRFIDAIRRGAAGGSALDPEVVGRMLGRRQDPLGALTAREREVLASMAEGRSNQGIAERLVVTEHAVEKHVSSILRKLDIAAGAGEHRRVLAVLAFLGRADAASD